ncbi:MAG TPA: outer membrane protein assembly factor BamE [Caulobacteraceae bacterium]|jgi:outer membrane protein assembly factor BamE (lipoprotein component of BamABCDE complex)|nr:outer membrane protein assembly factor BamE [Caulobacteraceae bacterium]
MSRILGVLAVSVSLLGTAACTPSNLYQGFQAIDANPNEVKVGTDNRSTVLARLGTPTATDTFDKSTWFYLTQMSSKTAFYHPRVIRRDVVAISFDKDTQAVTKVDVYGLKDGRVIAYNNRVTPTRGRELTVLEQLFGNLSTIGTLPPDENYTPGTHPGDTP